MVHWVLCNPSLLIYKINPEPLDLLILNVLENSSSMLLVQHPQSVLHIDSPTTRHSPGSLTNMIVLFLQLYLRHCYVTVTLSLMQYYIMLHWVLPSLEIF
jgi:hypothetical protein